MHCILKCSLSTQVYTRTMTKILHFFPGILGESKIIFGRVPIMFQSQNRGVPNMNLLPTGSRFRDVIPEHLWFARFAFTKPFWDVFQQFLYHLSSPEKEPGQNGKKTWPFVLDVTLGHDKKKHGKTTKNRKKSHEMHKIPPPKPWNDERSKNLPEKEARESPPREKP